MIKDEFTHIFTDEDPGDRDAIAYVTGINGGSYSARHDIRIDLTGFTAGTYNVRVVTQQGNGALVLLHEFTMTIA